MGYKERFRNRLKLILDDTTICKENRDFFKEFFEKEEYKLKRNNNMREVDESSCSTLYGYLDKLLNINKWFNNKPFKNITEEDFKKVYDDLEDGNILTKNGKPFVDKTSYYNKIFRSTPFEMLGKKDMVKKVMEFHGSGNNKKEVRYIPEEDIRKIIEVMIKREYKLLSWLAFDVGENINSLLRLTKRDCVRGINEYSKLPEYRINLRKETLKRSRTARSEPTNFPETTKLLDEILPALKDDDRLFNLSYEGSKKCLKRAIRITGVKCLPKGQEPTWKDFRSSMACDLLKKGWTTDEVNARLGHKPSSDEIDKYVNFLALERKVPQRKVYDNNLTKLQAELDASKEKQMLEARRTEALQERVKEIEKLLERSLKTFKTI